MSSQFNHQDWDPVILHKKGTKQTPQSKDAQIAENVRNNTQSTFQPKYNASKNTQNPSVSTHKYNDDEIPKVKQISHDFKVNLMNARQAKGWTQKELAQRINEKQTLIAEYESGKAIPNPSIINKMERVLITRLREPKN